MGPPAHAKENTWTCLASNNGPNQRKLEAVVPMGCAGGSGGKRDRWRSQWRTGMQQSCRASGAFASSLSPRWCLPAAKPNSGHASRALSLWGRLVVINQITVISLREEFRFYLQE